MKSEKFEKKFKLKSLKKKVKSEVVMLEDDFTFQFKPNSSSPMTTLLLKEQNKTGRVEDDFTLNVVFSSNDLTQF